VSTASLSATSRPKSSAQTISRRRSAATGLPRAGLGAVFLEYLRGDHHAFADDRHANIARQVQEDLDQLVLGPALAQRHVQMEGELRLAAGAGVGDDADQGARLIVEAGPGPQRAEYVLDRDIDEFLHHRVAVDTFGARFDRSIAHQPPPLRRPL